MMAVGINPLYLVSFCDGISPNLSSFSYQEDPLILCEKTRYVCSPKFDFKYYVKVKAAFCPLTISAELKLNSLKELQ